MAHDPRTKFDYSRLSETVLDKTDFHDLSRESYGHSSDPPPQLGEETGAHESVGGGNN